MTKNEVIETIRTWVQTTDDEYDIEEQGRVYGMMDCLELVKQIESERQTCEDAVSREAVLGLFAQNADAIRPYSKTWEEVKALPPVNPQQKTGHWIVHPKGIYAHLICDNCLSNAPYDCRTNYCPDCGAKMVEPQESEGKK